jgi:N6-adenosine-specific RNA methylase IME4
MRSDIFQPPHPFAGLRRQYYGALYIDPPWKFHAWSHRGEGKGACQHYACMSLADVCSLPVAQLAADDAVLFMWVVQPLLREAMQVLDAWEFSYRTVAFYWVKMPKTWTPESGRVRPRLGLGYHTRSGAEQCWLAVRGKGYKRQAQGIEQVLHSPLRRHSQKPDEIARRIERLVGDVPRLEMFARVRRPGWDCFGDELDLFGGAAS